MVGLRNEPVSEPIDIGAVQMARRAVLTLLGVAGFILLLLTRSLWTTHPGSIVDEVIQMVGLALLIVAILGRTWCSLFIGGRKKRRLVTVGPYSVCRNPLYVFSCLGAAGVGAQFGSISATAFVCLITMLVLTAVTYREERFLHQRFGAAYDSYFAQVPRFIPNWRLWHPVNVLAVRPALVARTFRDACLFLTAWPAAELAELLQDRGYVRDLCLLP